MSLVQAALSDWTNGNLLNDRENVHKSRQMCHYYGNDNEEEKGNNGLLIAEIPHLLAAFAGNVVTRSALVQFTMSTLFGFHMDLLQ